MQDVLESMEDIRSFDTTISAENRKKAVEALEEGKVVYFPHLAFDLNREEQRFLSPQWVNQKSKNVSYNPSNNQLSGTICKGQDEIQFKEMMHRYSIKSRMLLENLFPVYKPYLNLARTSFRPVEIAGRTSSYRKDDTLLHIDSFPATPVKGKRILRFFTNVNPDGKSRIWKLGEPFHQVVQKLGGDLKKPIPGLAWFLKTFKITKDYRTLYDHYMTSLHDKMKGDQEYQKNVTQYEIAFPPGSTWIVFTDQASHAALSGQYVFEQTSYLPIEGMSNPETSPLRILERFYGDKLV